MRWEQLNDTGKELAVLEFAIRFAKSLWGHPSAEWEARRRELAGEWIGELLDGIVEGLDPVRPQPNPVAEMPAEQKHLIEKIIPWEDITAEGHEFQKGFLATLYLSSRGRQLPKEARERWAEAAEAWHRQTEEWTGSGL